MNYDLMKTRLKQASRKSSIKPSAERAYLILDTPKGGSLVREALVKKLDDKDIYMIALSVFYLIFCGFKHSTYNFMSQMQIFDTVLSQTA